MARSESGDGGGRGEARSEGGTRRLPLGYQDARRTSPRPSICPFLRSDVDDDLTFPVEHPDPSNVCVALDEPLPQSNRQQELVCLVAGHATCPRYLRGVLVAPSVARPARRPLISPAIAASIAVLVVSAIVSVGYVAAAGGLSVPLTAAATSASPSASAVRSEVALASGPVVASGAVTPEPSVTPTPTPVPTATPEPPPEATPTSTLAPAARTAEPTPKPTPGPTPKPTSDRFAVLTPCAGRSNCYVYVIRSGDNLFSVAHWFGVPLDSIYTLNPWVRTTALRAGQELRIPTPTR